MTIEIYSAQTKKSVTSEWVAINYCKTLLYSHNVFYTGHTYFRFFTLSDDCLEQIRVCCEQERYQRFVVSVGGEIMSGSSTATEKSETVVSSL